MVSFKHVSLSFLVGLALLAFAHDQAHGQSRSMRGRPRINRSRAFFPPRPFSFDPFLRERLRFDPFLRQRSGFDAMRRREFDSFRRRQFIFDPFLGSGIFGFPASALTPFFFGGSIGF